MKARIIGSATLICLTALIGIGFVACSGDDPSVETYDEDAPRVVSVSPADSTTDVPLDTSLTLNFSEAIYPNTIHFNVEDSDCTGSLQLSLDHFSSCVPLSEQSLSYNEDQTTFTVSPQTALAASETYRIRITTGVKDLTLNPLETEYTMNPGFTTEADGEVPLNNASNIYFGDENTSEGILTGTIEVVRADDESDISGYTVYWGMSESDKLAGTAPIHSFSVDDEKLEAWLEDLTIPENATHFLVYASNDYGEAATCVSLDIPDTVLKLAADICPGGTGSGPKDFIVYNQKLFFSADGCDGYGRELWQYDGASEPSLAADIELSGGSSDPGQKVVFNQKLYFTAYDGAYGRELWEFDDFQASPTYNTVNYSEINFSGDANPGMLTVFKNTLFFRATDGGITYGNELWYYDGVSSPDIVYNINGAALDATPDGMTLYSNEDRLYFAANDGAGNRIWWYDGTIPTPVLFSQIDKMPSSPSIPFLPLGTELYEFNSNLYYRASDPTNGVEPWVYNGSTTSILMDIYPGANDSVPGWFREYNGRLFFAAQGSAGNKELWVHDGSNTWQIDDINSFGGSEPSELIVYNNMLIFRAFEGASGNELWGFSDDGEPATAFPLGDINPGPDGSMPSGFTVFNGRLYFSADDGTHGNELWVFYIE